MKIKVQVKQKHINKGIQDSVEFCPISHALCDMGHTLPKVYGDGIIDVQGYMNLQASRSAVRFITKFDKLGKKAVKPFNFILVW